MLNGAVYVMGEPLAVWFAWTPLTVSAPQSPCLFPGSIWHVKVQDAPPFPGSFVTTAIRFSENPTASDPPGSGLNVMETLFGGGGGYYGYSRWGSGGGMGIIGTVVLVAVILYFVGWLR